MKIRNSLASLKAKDGSYVVRRRGRTFVMNKTSPVIVVWEDGSPDDYFSGCRRAGKIHGPVSNEETDRASIYVCTGPIGGWDAAWPKLAHLSA